jgi:hypothetical protein
MSPLSDMETTVTADDMVAAPAGGGASECHFTPERGCLCAAFVRRAAGCALAEGRSLVPGVPRDSDEVPARRLAAARPLDCCFSSLMPGLLASEPLVHYNLDWEGQLTLGASPSRPSRRRRAAASFAEQPIGMRARMDTVPQEACANAGAGGD